MSPRRTSTRTTRSWRGSWTPTACTSATPRRQSSPGSRSRWAGRSAAARRPGRGVMIVTQEAAKHLGLAFEGATIAIQGFGNVGSVSADLLVRAGARVVAVTDWKGGVHNAKGLDIPKMLDYAREHKTIDGFPGGELDRQRRSVRDGRGRADPGRAREPDHDGQRRSRARQDPDRGGERPDDARRAQDAARARRLRRARYPRQLRRRHRVVFRMGAGSLRLLLGRARSQRTPRTEDARSVRRTCCRRR